MNEQPFSQSTRGQEDEHLLQDYLVGMYLYSTSELWQQNHGHGGCLGMSNLIWSRRLYPLMT